jgi:hypothetical protein
VSCRQVGGRRGSAANAVGLQSRFPSPGSALQPERGVGPACWQLQQWERTQSPGLVAKPSWEQQWEQTVQRRQALYGKRPEGGERGGWGGGAWSGLWVRCLRQQRAGTSNSIRSHTRLFMPVLLSERHTANDGHWTGSQRGEGVQLSQRCHLGVGVPGCLGVGPGTRCSPCGTCSMKDFSFNLECARVRARARAQGNPKHAGCMFVALLNESLACSSSSC